MTWLNRMLVESPVNYGLCISEKQFNKELKQLKLKRNAVPNWILNERSAATTHYFVSDGKTVAVVCIDPKRAPSKAQAYALLVHEAVHIWQEIRENIGEKSPSAEFEAYSVQRISLELIYEYMRQVKR